MAIVRVGEMIAGVSGTIGGVVYARNKSSTYARSYSRPRAKRTGLQSDQRHRLALSPQAWRSLTAGQQSDWNDWAALPGQAKTNSLGVEYFLSGWQWFTAVNLWRQTMGLGMRNDAPTLGWPASPVISSLTFTESGNVPTLIVEVAPGTVGVDEGLTVWASFCSGGGRAVEFRGYWLMFAELCEGQETFDVSAEFLGQFGSVSSGDKVFVRCEKQNSEGLRSDYAEIAGVIA